jgi:putative membrane protein
LIHTDTTFSKRVEQAVTELESGTAAEVVVVAAERSGSYRDVAYLLASIAAVAFLVVQMWAPYHLHPATVVVDIILGWVVVAWLANDRRAIRVFTRHARREAQVAAAAAAAFHQEAVHGTPQRTGLLVYVSALEGTVELIPDVGLEERIARGRWLAAEEAFSHADLDHFLEGLKRVGTLLAESVPPTEDDGIDLPNAPRVRP